MNQGRCASETVGVRVRCGRKCRVRRSGCGSVTRRAQQSGIDLADFMERIQSELDRRGYPGKSAS